MSALFEKTFTDMDLQEIIIRATETRDLKVNAFTMQLARGATEHQEEIDALIESKLKNWKLSRISRYLYLSLRMAVYELKYLNDIPMNVTINRAVESLQNNTPTRTITLFINGV